MTNHQQLSCMSSHLIKNLHSKRTSLEDVHQSYNVDPNSIKTMIRSIIGPDGTKWAFCTPIHVASIHGNIQVIRLLCQLDAIIDIRAMVCFVCLLACLAVCLVVCLLAYLLACLAIA